MLTAAIGRWPTSVIASFLVGERSASERKADIALESKNYHLLTVTELNADIPVIYSRDRANG